MKPTREQLLQALAGLVDCLECDNPYDDSTELTWHCKGHISIAIAHAHHLLRKELHA
jgi:hypothetical protein